MKTRFPGILALRCAAVSCGILLSACASVYSVTVDPARNDVYGGVRLDGRIIGAAATNGSVACGLPNCEAPRVWMLAGGAVCDLPLSLIGDTLLLPYTAIRALTSGPADTPG